MLKSTTPCDEKESKWSIPGWKLESKYIDSVLIGNWFEERLQFPRGRSICNSTNRLDYRDTDGHIPDTQLRRKLALRNWEGIGQHCLLDHHGKSYMSSGLSTHMADYQHPLCVAPFKNRRWDGHRSSWIPERLDIPVPESEKCKLLHRNTQCNIPVIPTADNDDESRSSQASQPRQSASFFKYRHRKSDVSPFFPVILRSTK